MCLGKETKSAPVALKSALAPKAPNMQRDPSATISPATTTYTVTLTLTADQRAILAHVVDKVKWYEAREAGYGDFGAIYTQLLAGSTVRPYDIPSRIFSC
jgi:hypothetical protein